MLVYNFSFEIYLLFENTSFQVILKVNDLIARLIKSQGCGAIPACKSLVINLDTPVI